MKKMLLLLTVFSLSFCGTAYLSYDMDASLDIEGALTGDFDDGSLMVGYNHKVNEGDQMSFAIGFNYAISPLSADDTPKDAEFTTYSLYGMVNYGLSESMYMFGTLGYGFASDDNDWFGSGYDINPGLSYGLGFGYALSDTWSVGLGYNMTNYELEVTSQGVSVDLDLDVDRTFLYAAYSF